MSDPKSVKFLKALGAGLLVVVLFGGGIKTFLGLSEKGEERHQKLYRSVFKLYWESLRAGHVDEAKPFRTESWNAVNDGRKLAATYQTLQAEHGKLKQPHILRARPVKNPREHGEKMSIECAFEFEDGTQDVVTYTVTRPEPGAVWKIDASLTEENSPLGQGPF